MSVCVCMYMFMRVYGWMNDEMRNNPKRERERERVREKERVRERERERERE